MSEDTNKRPGAKIVKLREIKTNGQRIRRKQIAEDVGNLKQVIHAHDVVAYAVVMWTRGETELAFWDTEALGVAGPIRGELAKRALDRLAAQRDTHRMLYEDEEDGSE